MLDKNDIVDGNLWIFSLASRNTVPLGSHNIMAPIKMCSTPVYEIIWVMGEVSRESVFSVNHTQESDLPS